MVDADGIVLPDPFSAEQADHVRRTADGRPNLRVIDGVRGPPPTPGQPWAGDDVRAGLDLVRLFHGLPYLDDVAAVDVSNLNGRAHRGDAQVVLETGEGTQVRWGRPVGAKDFFVEAPVAHKLAALRAIAAKYGRLDAGRPWVDVRFDVNLTAAADTTPADGPRRAVRLARLAACGFADHRSRFAGRPTHLTCEAASGRSGVRVGTGESFRQRSSGPA